MSAIYNPLQVFLDNFKAYHRKHNANDRPIMRMVNKLKIEDLTIVVKGFDENENFYGDILLRGRWTVMNNQKWTRCPVWDLFKSTKPPLDTFDNIHLASDRLGAFVDPLLAPSVTFRRCIENPVTQADFFTEFVEEMDYPYPIETWKRTDADDPTYKLDEICTYGIFHAVTEQTYDIPLPNRDSNLNFAYVPDESNRGKGVTVTALINKARIFPKMEELAASEGDTTHIGYYVSRSIGKTNYTERFLPHPTLDWACIYSCGYPGMLYNITTGVGRVPPSFYFDDPHVKVINEEDAPYHPQGFYSLAHNKELIYVYPEPPEGFDTPEMLPIHIAESAVMFCKPLSVLDTTPWFKPVTDNPTLLGMGAGNFHVGHRAIRTKPLPDGVEAPTTMGTVDTRKEPVKIVVKDLDHGKPVIPE